MKTDMSPQAVKRRLKQTSELRKLCLALGKNNYGNHKKIPKIQAAGKEL